MKKTVIFAGVLALAVVAFIDVERDGNRLTVSLRSLSPSHKAPLSTEDKIINKVLDDPAAAYERAKKAGSKWYYETATGRRDDAATSFSLKLPFFKPKTRGLADDLNDLGESVLRAIADEEPSWFEQHRGSLILAAIVFVMVCAIGTIVRRKKKPAASSGQA